MTGSPPPLHRLSEPPPLHHRTLAIHPARRPCPSVLPPLHADHAIGRSTLMAAISSTLHLPPCCHRPSRASAPFHWPLRLLCHYPLVPLPLLPPNVPPPSSQPVPILAVTLMPARAPPCRAIPQVTDNRWTTMRATSTSSPMLTVIFTVTETRRPCFLPWSRPCPCDHVTEAPCDALLPSSSSTSTPPCYRPRHPPPPHGPPAPPPLHLASPVEDPAKISTGMPFRLLPHLPLWPSLCSIIPGCRQDPCDPIWAVYRSAEPIQSSKRSNDQDN